MHYRVKQKKQVSKWQVCQGYHLCKGTKKDLDAVYICAQPQKKGWRAMTQGDPRWVIVYLCTIM